MPAGKGTETERVAELILRSFGADSVAVMVMSAGGLPNVSFGVVIRETPGRRGSSVMRAMADVLRATAASLEADAVEREATED